MYRKVIKTVSNIKSFKFNIKVKFYSNESYVIRSPIQNVHIPNATIPDLILERCGNYPDKIALECAVTGRKYTYEELRRKAINFSRALIKKLKLSKGDVVALVLPNIPEFGICLLGVLKASLTVTTISILNTPDEIRRHLLDSKSKAIITTCSFHSVISSVVASYPLANIPIMTIKTQKTDSTPENSINFEEFVKTSHVDVNLRMESGDIALMPYSSGTTGFPKGVLHSHQGLTANLMQANAEEFKILETTTGNHQDVVPCISPFVHLYGLNGILLNGLYNIAKMVTVPRFTPDLFINIFRKHKPTVFYTVPATIVFMTDNKMIDETILDSLRVVTVGSAPFSAYHEKRFLQKTKKKICLMQGYGTTESGIITSTRKYDEPAGSVGVPVPNTEMKVVAVDTDVTLGAYKEGELFVKGPQIMQGYHNRSSDTTKTIVDGWLRTGDLVHYDKNNNFYVVDRLKDIIKVKGFQVAPAELETVIRNYPNISDTIVIGVPHSTYGEVPRAYVTLKSETTLNIDKLTKYVAEKVSNYKQLKGGVVVVKDLPKNSFGKYVRYKLKSQVM